MNETTTQETATQETAPPAAALRWRPTDLAQLRDAVADTSGRLAVTGRGTAFGWAGRLAPVDAVLDLSGLTGVITHNPGDMTVSVRAGTPLRELNAELADHGQHIALDAARIAAGATVGGLLATGDAGPGALVFGTLRDLVIGATVVLPDATVARSGGHVIKNVAGYDLTKLLHGAHGTLAVVAEIVLRAHPLPHATATLVVDADLDQAVELAGGLCTGPLEPAAVEWTSDRQLLVRVAGTEQALPARLDRVQAAMGGAAQVAGDDPWTRHAELVSGPSGSDHEMAVLRVGVRPSRLAGVLAGLSGVSTAVTAGLGTGVATVVLPVDAVPAAHTAVHAAGGVSMLRDRPALASVAAWGPAPSAWPVLAGLRRTFDPDARLGPGRFAPWEHETHPVPRRPEDGSMSELASHHRGATR